MNVLYCADYKYFNFLRLSVLTLLEFNDNVTIHIFTMDSPETNQKALSKNQIAQLIKECSETNKQFDVKIYNVREWFEKYMINSCNLNSFYTPYAALRLLAPYILDCDKVLYLDCDIIVLKSLVPIYNQEFAGSYILAPRFYNDESFINGIFLQNLKREREVNYKNTNEAISIYNTFVHEYPDMNAMNKAFKDCQHLNVGNLYTYNPENSFVFHISSKEVDETNNFLKNCVFSKTAREIRKKIIKIVQFIDKKQFEVDKNWREMILVKG